MKAKTEGAGAARPAPIRMLLPTRQASLFRWLLAEGFRSMSPMTLMSIGEYQDPRGCWFPSILY